LKEVVNPSDGYVWKYKSDFWKEDRNNVSMVKKIIIIIGLKL